MASRIIAQLLVAGSAVVFRAAVNAYRQAIINGQKAGMTAESVKKVTSYQMSLDEARKILGVETNSRWEDILKKYDHLFKVNERDGSFYLQSKIYRAKERLEQENVDSENNDEKQSN